MRAVQLAKSGQLVVTDAPKPQPGPGEVLVRVHAAGVTTTELDWDPTVHTKTGAARTDAIIGHEFSGVVEALGEGVDSLHAGDAIFGMNDWFAEGAMAEYCLAPQAAVAPKPARVSHTEAAAVPIGALTAWQAIFDHAHLQAGEQVLIHGGAGAVGTFAIQLARLHGAHVITTASSANSAFVSELGAGQVIDYRATRFDQILKNLDVVFDTVGGETLERSWGILKPGGRLVTVVSPAEGSSDPRIKQAFFIVEPKRQQLVEIGELLESGQLLSVVDSVAPLSRAPDVFAGKWPRQRRGKIVISLEDNR